jgi:hypothetical protein
MNSQWDEVEKIVDSDQQEIHGIQAEFLVDHRLDLRLLLQLGLFLQHSEQIQEVRFVSLRVCVE